MNDVGSITISRVQCSGGNDYISVTVTDSNFRRLLEASLPLDGFARALTGLAYVDLSELRTYPENK